MSLFLEFYGTLNHFVNSINIRFYETSAVLHWVVIIEFISINGGVSAILRIFKKFRQTFVMKCSFYKFGQRVILRKLHSVADELWRISKIFLSSSFSEKFWTTALAMEQFIESFPVSLYQ